MTEEEKLKEYVRRNAPKAQKSVSLGSPAVMKAVALTRPRSPRAFYGRKIIGDVIGLMFITFMISFLLLLYLNANKALESMVVLTWTLGIIGLFVLLIIGISLFYWFRYINWINSRYYVLKGWNDFFDKRSPSFWSKRMYTNVQVSFTLKNSATNLHREAMLAFIKNVIKKWNKRYKGIDWESGYGTPKDIVSDGMSFHGDISRVELIRVVRTLTSDFIPLATLLGSHLEEVSIESKSTEVEIKTKKVSRNAYDRQSGFGK